MWTQVTPLAFHTAKDRTVLVLLVEHSGGRMQKVEMPFPSGTTLDSVKSFARAVLARLNSDDDIQTTIKLNQPLDLTVPTPKPPDPPSAEQQRRNLVSQRASVWQLKKRGFAAGLTSQEDVDAAFNDLRAVFQRGDEDVL